MGLKKFSRIEVPAGTSFRNPYILLATWFGAGLVRPAPGTMGSLAAIPLGYAIAFFWGPLALLAASLLFIIIGTKAANYYGKKSGVVDDQSIVIDEVVGMWIAALPAFTNLWAWLLAFLLFRLFDIWKPWPVSLFDDRSRDGFDVVMDDVVAGIYALCGVSMLSLFLIQG